MKIFPQRKSSILSLVIILICIFLIGISTYKVQQQRNEKEQDLINTQKTIYYAEHIQSLALKIEDGGRGFLLTGDSAFLEPFITARNYVFEDLAALRQITADDTTDQRLIDTLDLFIKQRLAIGNELRNLKKEQGLEAAIALIKTKQGKNLTDRILQIIDTIREQEKNELGEDIKANEHSIATFNLFIWVLMALMVATGFGLFIMRVLAQRQHLKDVAEKENAETELASAEKKLLVILENSADGLALINEKHEIIYRAPNSEKLLGYKADELSSNVPLHLIHPDDHKNLAEAFAKTLHQPGKKVSFEYRFLHKNGNYIWFEGTYINLLADENIKAIEFNYHDITEAKKGADELEKRESGLNEAQRISKIGSWEMDFKTNKLTWSDEMYSIYNCDPLTFEPSIESLIQLILPEHRQSMKNYMASVTSSGNEEGIDFRINTANGTTKCIRGRAVAVLGNDGEIVKIHGTTQDITERKKAEQELKEAYQYNSLLLASIAEGVYGVDTSGKCTFVNQSFLKLLGYANESEIIGKPIHQLIHHSHADGTNYPASECKMLKTRITKEHITVETEVFWRRDGSSIPVEYRSYPIIQEGQVLGAICTFNDIAARKRTENFQRLSNNILTVLNGDYSLKEMVNATLDLIQKETKLSAVAIRLKNGEDFPYFSQRGFNDEFLKTENSLIAKDHNGKICRDKDGKPKLECTCGFVLSGVVSPLLTHDGSFITNNSYPLLDLTVEQDPRFQPRNHCIHFGYGSVAIIPIKANEKIVGTLQLNDEQQDAFPDDMIRFFEGMGLIIGSALMRKQAEEAISELNNTLELRVHDRTLELIEANTALEAFSYSASHDLRAPLRNITGFTKMINKRYGQNFDPDLKDMFGHVESCANRMDAIIVDMLALARFGKEKLHKAEVDMNILFSKVCDSLAFSLSHNAKVDISALPTLQADASMLEQVLINLVGNAIKYSSKKEKPVIQIGCNYNDEKYTFYIKDNGAGFDMKYYERLFGAFQRLHGSSDFEGTGVGLTLVKRIIEKHGGHIWAEAKVDEGATFYFTLPVVNANQSTADEPSYQLSI